MGTPTRSALADAIEELENARHRCPFGQWMEDLDDNYRSLVEEALGRIEHNREVNGKSSQGATSPWLANYLAEDGHKWTSDQISHHLRGKRGAGCRCSG